MKPPYTISPSILNLVASISLKIGEASAHYLDKKSPQLRKANRIKTIQATLGIEGNTLNESQVQAIDEGKLLLGFERDQKEVQNAIALYARWDEFDPSKRASFLNAHLLLMQGLVTNPGEYRNRSVGITKGKTLTHIAPPAERVSYLMDDLFDYVARDPDPLLIKSCVFHYELEFIHPFLDGNGRMGRFWQSLLLSKSHPIFEFLPFETIIAASQSAYYQALAKSDACAQSTPFIEYMLGVLDQSLANLLNTTNVVLSETERIEYFIFIGMKDFSRKDYQRVFKNLSTATASRDLKKGVELALFSTYGERNATRYRVLM
ncbi:Fic family protein [Aquirufa novilacunae]|jgi:Fic family protein|uniref:Fic family protein n=1 Tax=Aquirufa novilacunae TaxID=3139305 RepID=A0ABW8U566_9BACT